MGRMLTVDPERRATIPQIREHLWLRVCAADADAESGRAAATLMGASVRDQVEESLLTGMAQLELAPGPEYGKSPEAI